MANYRINSSVVYKQDSSRQAGENAGGKRAVTVRANWATGVNWRLSTFLAVLIPRAAGPLLATLASAADATSITIIVSTASMIKTTNDVVLDSDDNGDYDDALLLPFLLKHSQFAHVNVERMLTTSRRSISCESALHRGTRLLLKHRSAYIYTRICVYIYTHVYLCIYMYVCMYAYRIVMAGT